MKMRRGALITLVLAGLMGFGLLISASSLADDHHTLGT